jgi:hypothetical protein
MGDPSPLPSQVIRGERFALKRPPEGRNRAVLEGSIATSADDSLPCPGKEGSSNPRGPSMLFDPAGTITKMLRSGPAGGGLFQPTGSAAGNAFIGRTGAPDHVPVEIGAPK